MISILKNTQLRYFYTELMGILVSFFRSFDPHASTKLRSVLYIFLTLTATQNKCDGSTVTEETLFTRSGRPGTWCRRRYGKQSEKKRVWSSADGAKSPRARCLLGLFLVVFRFWFRLLFVLCRVQIVMLMG